MIRYYKYQNPSPEGTKITTISWFVVLPSPLKKDMTSSIEMMIIHNISQLYSDEKEKSRSKAPTSHGHDVMVSIVFFCFFSGAGPPGTNPETDVFDSSD